jgi:pimeloyl-ACP methyl ester carboxylesterase
MKPLVLIITLLIASSVSAQSVDTTKIGNNDKVGKYANIRGFKMYYEVYGSGEPVLFIHGNGGSIASWRNQIPHFAKKYKVIIADSRAQGKSHDDGDSLTYEMMADDLAALLDQLKIDSCDVVGWSDGGINGLLLAIRHPKKVKKLAVTGANLQPDSTAVPYWLNKMVMDQYDSLSKLKRTPQVKNDMKLVHLLAYQPHIKVSALHKIACPTLVIGGDHDLILPKHTLLIADNIKRSYLWIIPNSGHSTPEVYKNEFNRKVSEFLVKPYRRIEGMDRMR